MTARISIRQKLYRGQNGWLVYGTDAMGRRISIFTALHEQAERIKQEIKLGRNDRIDDILLGREAAYHEDCDEDDRELHGCGVRNVVQSDHA